MKLKKCQPVSLKPRKIKAEYLLTIMLTVIILFSVDGYANTINIPKPNRISIENISTQVKDGYGYKLEYYVPAPIETFWLFKTDFNNDFLLTNDLIVGHRLIETIDNTVITENRYATAPGLKFIWHTTVLADQYRLEFKLINAEDCRHDFHYGTIQLNPAGNYTKVTQTAYFDFAGASLWVKYPWYGGMKSTLTKVSRWEQKIALQYKGRYMVAMEDHIRQGR